MDYSFIGEWDYGDNPRTFIIAVTGDNALDRATRIQEDLAEIRQRIVQLALCLSAEDVLVSDDYADHAGCTGVFDEGDPGFSHRGTAIRLDTGKGWRQVFDTVAQLVAETDPENTFVAW